ncbi:hypothetical protein [Nocardioides bizhenqiangii]|uniref:Glycosyltransferase RgtA/B/C/D-like domain-containing protein n=1 Tax=Nocardioides bizhenqiangii TaxID=3095076 RepID=A0ABZ0ZRA5_9ACTN|nr:hypothetical protein [Nocardioides sp. HM61]WQQ26309.1 hypothetical protein SHK19_20405 [Nocardioides sp. HM61]
MTARPPRFLVWVSAGVVAAGVTMSVVGALRTGISWDEPFHVMRLRNLFEHGWFSVDWSTDAGGSIAGDNNTLVYGPVMMLLLHGLCVLVGVEDWNAVATSPTAYDVRHLGVVIIGLVGTAAASGITRILLRSWSWAAVTAGVLFALPMWTGHVMFNIKDVPVASGYTLMTLALLAMVTPTQARRSWRVTGLVLGAVLMVGTRPAMWSALVLGVAIVGCGWMVIRRSRAAEGEVRPAWGEALTGLAAAWAILAVIYPNVFAHPSMLLRSASQSASFRENDAWGYLYIPFHLAAQFPLLLQGLAAIGLWVAIRAALRRQDRDPVLSTQLTLVLAQVLALPLLAFAKNSDLYNGLRQLLFASPAWAVLVTLGMAHLLGWAVHRTRLVGGIAALSLVLPVADQATLFPYQYTYFNPALDATGAHVDSDYWRTSVPELLPAIPTDGQVICGPTRSTQIGQSPADDEEATIAGRYSSDSSVDCRVDPLGPLSSPWTALGLPLGDTLPRDEFYVVIDRDHALPSNCTQLASVTRHRHWRQVSMTYLARCRLAPSPIGDGVAFVRPEGENMAPALWAYAPEGWVMRETASAIDAAGPSASLTFRAPEACRRRACALELRGEAGPDLGVALNDVPVPVDVKADEVTVPLPAGVTAAWVTFTSTTGAPLGLRVHTIRVIPTGVG